MLRKLLPLLLAGVTFIFVWLALSPGQQTQIAVAAVDLPAGHVIRAEDVTMRAVPADLVPTNALSATTPLLGQTLAVPRTAGDALLLSHLGQAVTLKPDERALAVRVTDSTGLAGLLQPGQHVGVAAVLFDSFGTGAYSKVTVRGMRVLYVPPAFRAVDDSTQKPSTSSVGPQRQTQSVVVLAVPVTPQDIVYDAPPSTDPQIVPTPQTHKVNPVELLAALSAAQNAALTLFLEPESPAPFSTTGLYLPDLIVRPITPTVTDGVK